MRECGRLIRVCLCVCVSRTERVITFPIFDLPHAREHSLTFCKPRRERGGERMSCFFNDLQQCCHVIITMLALSSSFFPHHLSTCPSIHPSIPPSLSFLSTNSSVTPGTRRARLCAKIIREQTVRRGTSNRRCPKSLIISCTDTREHFRDTRGFASRATTSDTIDNTSTLSLRSSVSVYICVIIRGVRKRRALVRYRSNVKK